jgi:Fur family ferric uptake transcriptional regulator/Fur family peroxide stress response transcriptional regulator
MSMTTTADNAAWDTELIGSLRDRGQRVTSQRLLIHRAFRELDHHASAEEVLAAVSPRLPNVSLPTVYATLDLFRELGIARRVSAGRGAILYDPRGDAHHHLVCRRCGRVEDLDARIDVMPAMRAAGRSGFAADGAEIVLSGLCSSCR